MTFDAIRRSEEAKRMYAYMQHGGTPTYIHCENVARMSDAIDRRLRLGADREVLLTGAMLHDYYLYDWHRKDDGSHRLHGFSHAERARRNAVEAFGVDGRVQHVIATHMWPLNLTRLPRTREAWIVCLADKCCAMREMLCGARRKRRPATENG